MTKAKTTKKNAEPVNALAVDPLQQILAAARKNWETDADLETKGIDIEVDKVGTFTVIRTTVRNKAWIKEVKKRYAPHGEITDEELRKSIDIGIFADTVIVGLKTLDGKTVPYDSKAKQAVKEMLTNIPDLYDLLQFKAADATNFLKSYEAEAKN